MSDTIIVGVTDSSAGRRAVDWAARRAADRRQRLVLLSVVGGAVGIVGEGEVVDAALAAAREMLEGHAARLRETGVEVETRVARGNPVEQLIEASREASLLVIGSDYRGPTSDRVRGVHGIRVVAGAHAPVVVLPDIELGERSGVVVGVDGSAASEGAVAFAAAEAERLGEPLIAVGAWMPLSVPRPAAVHAEHYLENLQHLTEENVSLALAGLRQDYPDLEIRQHVVQGRPSVVIDRFAAEARLAVLGTHGRGAIARFLLGSVSQEVLGRLATVTAIVR